MEITRELKVNALKYLFACEKGCRKKWKITIMNQSVEI